MGTNTAPGPRQKRFAAYLDGLAKAAGHADRRIPLKNYCTGLLLPGERKSVEPMAARLAPGNVRRMHQSLHHLVADAPWSDEAVMRQVRAVVLPALRKHGEIVYWIVDDTGFPKKGGHSVGVTRQYCGQLGKQENCRVAVSLSVATGSSSLPIAYRLYLPEEWASNPERRREAGVPEEVRFQTKPQIALEQIRHAVEEEIPRGVVLADAGYGNDGRFRSGVRELELEYVVGVQSSITVWKPGMEPLPPLPRQRMGRPPRLLRRDRDHQPVTARELALSLPAESWKMVSWRQGTRQKLRSRFAAVRLRPAHRDYEELKQELGLGHFEGRGWRGFHHHATLCIAAYGFLVSERSRFSPSARAGGLELRVPEIPPDFQPRGSSHAGRAA